MTIKFANSPEQAAAQIDTSIVDRMVSEIFARHESNIPFAGIYLKNADRTVLSVDVYYEPFANKVQDASEYVYDGDILGLFI